MENLDVVCEDIILDSDNEENDIGKVNTALVYSRESETSSSESEDDDSNINLWTKTIKKPERWPSIEPNNGVNFGLLKGCKTPASYYSLLIDNDIVDLIVKETKQYALTRGENYNPTDNYEIKQFFGIILQIGFVCLPKLEDYWSNRADIGGNPICGKIMTRTRFYTLMKFLHLVDNEKSSTSRTYKIDDFMRLYISKCQLFLTPDRNVCIDESLIPFRGRLRFRQYLPNKKKKYGIKIFKLCTARIYL